MRVGFTIIYNGAHHLLHNEWAEKLCKMLDLWIIVEGAANPGGSTAWCKELTDKSSNDGTLTILNEIEYSSSKVRFIAGPPDGWSSKDDMVNAAISVVEKETVGRGCVVNLWQLDIDEQWTLQQMEDAERMLVNADADCGCFHARHYVGRGLVAEGVWGEGNDPTDPLRNAYRRLWRWKGQRFASHEPPMLEGGNGKEVLLPQKFDHFSYYFLKDVAFKQRYYQGYEGLCDRWASLQVETEFPQPLSRLITGHWGNTATVIRQV